VIINIELDLIIPLSYPVGVHPIPYGVLMLMYINDIFPIFSTLLYLSIMLKGTFTLECIHRAIGSGQG
jgi:hypothetical protein